VNGLLGLAVALGALVDWRTNYAPADSAAAARNAWREARTAVAAHDTATAFARARRAHEAWPAQWVYAYGLASMSAAVGDTATAAGALDDLWQIGAGPDFARDTTLVALAARSPAVRTAMAHVAENRAPEPTSELAFTFAPEDSAFWPEGLARDPRDGAFFVTSVRQRKVALVEPHQPPRDFVSGPAAGLDAALAVAIDPGRDLVWVTSAALPQMDGYVPADSGRASIDAFRRSTGKHVLHYPLPPAPEGHVPGDVLVTPEGDVYVTDSAHPAIYRVRQNTANGAPAEEWFTDPAFRSLQGQALTSGGRVLFVADYSHGLCAIRIETKERVWLRAPKGQCTLGLDGITRYGSDLIAVQNGIDPPRLVRVRIDESARDPLGNSVFHVLLVETLDRRIPLADEPTSVVAGPDGFYYVANSQWEKVDDQGKRKPGVHFVQPVVLKVPFIRH
jgi:hypothetical protein